MTFRIGKQSLLITTLAFFKAALIWTGCSAVDATDNRNPEGYDLSTPQIIHLPAELDEISGLAYYQKDNAVFAITDEIGFLYKIYLDHPKDIEKWEFGPNGDYEDLSLVDSIFYVLNSKGEIAAFKFLTHDTLVFESFPLAIGPGNEFETLYYDDQKQRLVMLCKDCDHDKKSELSGYTFDPATHRYDEGMLRMDARRIAALAGKDKIKFKPSAAAIHPITGELYLLSNVNKMLVVADRNGSAKEVFNLDETTFKQPEGLTFKPDGTMIISNEMADQGLANILIFPYQKKTVDKK